ncbi:MAG TPA: trehalose-phosphatase [Candidatus Limnocylindrales bacterium]|jgi:trehalose 6-phosphate phosphatase|nr:trehalose-phosphatase [Candidatus Limnocylindrales bacterium]
MTHLLEDSGTKTLSELAHTRLLVAFDFDGTLAPIVPDRERAEMRPDTRRLVEQVCSLYPCAVISGRSRSDVEHRVGGTGIQHVVGNHGIEPCSRMAQFERDSGEAYQRLMELLGNRQDIDIENKRYSLAVHYRRSPHRADARRVIRAAIKELTQRVRVVPGKLVFNVVPAEAPNKGNALLQVMNAEEVEHALYIGDDVTDEDAFRLGPSEHVTSVRVGPSRSTAAEYFLSDQHEVDSVLEQLARFRSAA